MFCVRKFHTHNICQQIYSHFCWLHIFRDVQHMWIKKFTSWIKGGGKSMTNQVFMNVEEVAEELGTSKSYAYKLIQKLNDEMNCKGYITIQGKINRFYWFMVKEGKWMPVYKDESSGTWYVYKLM